VVATSIASSGEGRGRATAESVAPAAPGPALAILVDLADRFAHLGGLLVQAGQAASSPAATADQLSLSAATRRRACGTRAGS
jgi:hypothetical protein